jgi:hypothetical protein
MCDSDNTEHKIEHKTEGLTTLRYSQNTGSFCAVISTLHVPHHSQNRYQQWLLCQEAGHNINDNNVNTDYGDK